MKYAMDFLCGLMMVGIGLTTAAEEAKVAVYTGNGDGINTSSFGKADVWDNGIAPTAAEAAEWDYVLKGNKTFRGPNIGGGQYYTVRAKSFTIGEVGGTWGSINDCNTGSGTLEFKGTLVFANGNWNRANDRNSEGTLAANVTVTAPENAPFAFYSSEPRGRGHYRFPGKWTAAPGSAIDFSSNCSNNMDFAVKFLGDTSEFKAKVTVKARKASKPTYDMTPMHVWVSSPVFAANVVVEREADFGAFTAADAVDVASLTLKDGAWLHVPADGVAGNCGRLRIVDSFSAEGRVTINLEGVLSSSGGRLAILSLSNTCTGSLNKDAFEIDMSKLTYALPRDVAFVVEPDEATGESTLYLTFTPVVQLLRNDSFDNGTGNAGELSSVTNGPSWTDGRPVHPGADYLVGTIPDKMTLRTEYVESSTFAGRSLTLAKNAQLTEMSRNWTVTNLFVYPGAALKQVYTGGDHNWNGETMMTFSETRSDRIAIYSYFNNRLHLNHELTGNGNLLFQASGGSFWPNGYFILAGLNTNFTGTILVSIDNNSSRNTGVSPSLVNFAQLEFADKRNLGGPLPAFDPKALVLEQMSVLRPSATVTLDEPTRGVFIGNMGRISTAEGLSLTLVSPLAVHGHLRKDGPGRLALGGPLSFGETGRATEPAAGSNLLSVVEGALQPLSADCCNGLEIVYSNGVKTVFAVDSANAELTAFGLRNLKAAKPFELAGDDGKMHVVFELPAGFAPTVFTQAVATVGDAAAETLRNRIVCDNRPRGYSVTFGEKVNGDGTVTFFAELKRKGLLVVVR